jgi:enoyl-CoA hydratase
VQVLVNVHLLTAQSPTSLKIALRQLQLGATMSLGQDLQMEYRLATRFLQDKDFREGVRAGEWVSWGQLIK